MFRKKIQKNANVTLVSLMQHQFDGELARKEALRSKSAHLMTVTALIMTAAISMFVFCLSVSNHPLFTGILFILWGVLSIFLVASLLNNLKSYKDIDVAHWGSDQLGDMWNDAEEDTLLNVFTHFKKMIDDLRKYNNKIFKRNRNARKLLKWATIFFIVFSFFLYGIAITQICH